MAYQSITLAQLLVRLGDKVENQPYWTSDEGTRAINEGLRTYGLLTGRWHQRLVIPTTAMNIDYGFDASLLYRTRVAFNGFTMDPSSREDLNNGRPHWRTESTASGGSTPTRPTLWAPVSLQLIYIWPQDAVGGNALTLDGVSATPVLVNAGDYVDLGEEDISILLGYALHALSLKKGGPWFAATQPLFVQFLQAAAAENSLISTSQAYRRFMGLDHRDQKPFREVVATLSQLIGSLQTGGGA